VIGRGFRRPTRQPTAQQLEDLAEQLEAAKHGPTIIRPPGDDPAVLGYAIAATGQDGQPGLTHTTILTRDQATYEITQWKSRHDGRTYQICEIRAAP
jgi:hypothetical protein